VVAVLSLIALQMLVATVFWSPLAAEVKVVLPTMLEPPTVTAFSCWPAVVALITRFAVACTPAAPVLFQPPR
jgi:hypothetical protein